MPDIAKSGIPSLATTLPGPENTLGGLKAGELIGAGDACYIKTDGFVWKSTGAAANAAARVRGFAAKAASVNEAVTLLRDVTFHYGAALTPGAEYFLSSILAGALSDTATVGGVTPIGFAYDATRIRLVPNI